MMKFALFLVCALVAVQGFEARSVQPEERALSDIVDAIKAAIEKVKQIISNITSQIPELIQNIKDKIKDIVGQVPEIIQNIKDKIQDLIHLAGEVGRKCVDASKPDIDALIEFAKDGFKGCVAEAESKTEAVKEQFDVLVGKVSALRDDIVARTLKCVDDHKLNPVALFNCLREQVEPVKDEIVEIEKEVSTTVALAREAAKEAGIALADCSLKVQKEVSAKEAAILDSIKECIAAATA